ncbi:MAG: very short patch repair endonuclease [Burkholderiaceae bacterium]|nr:very short patch repair endonuclease [Burkholderiaceae bacterium]
MARVRSSGSKIELVLGSAMWRRGIRYRKQYRKVPGRPDFAVVRAKLAIFCDSSFWHGRGWPESAAAFHTNRHFWLPKIEGNIRRDAEVNELLAQLGWSVLRFWDDDILERTDECVASVLHALKASRSLANDDENGSG